MGRENWGQMPPLRVYPLKMVPKMHQNTISTHEIGKIGKGHPSPHLIPQVPSIHPDPGCASGPNSTCFDLLRTCCPTCWTTNPRKSGSKYSLAFPAVVTSRIDINLTWQWPKSQTSIQLYWLFHISRCWCRYTVSLPASGRNVCRGIFHSAAWQTSRSPGDELAQ